MKVEVISEKGFNVALLGMGLSHGVTSEKSVDDLIFEVETKNRLIKRADQLADMDGGHNKFLESIYIALDIDAPVYWWVQFDTYRTGVTKQSESKMHTILKRLLTQEDFSDHVDSRVVDIVNEKIAKGDFDGAVANLPHGFIQRRIVATNYKTLRNIILQRHDHKLQEWRLFCDEIVAKARYSQYLCGKAYQCC